MNPEKKSKTREKEGSIESFVNVFVLWNFFPGNRAPSRSQKLVYIIIQIGIYPIIMAYAISISEQSLMLDIVHNVQISEHSLKSRL